MTFATTEKISAYGGFQLPLEKLEELLKRYMEKGINFSYNHDPATRFKMDVVDGGIRELANGEKAGWIDVVVPSDRYEEVKKKLDSGEFHGVSINIYDHLSDLGKGDIEIAIAGDPSYWPAETILALGQTLTGFSAVEVNHVRQFAMDPNALFIVQTVSQIPIGLLTSFLYDLLKSTKKRPVFIDMTFRREGTDDFGLVIEASSEKLIESAMASLPKWLASSETEIGLKE